MKTTKFEKFYSEKMTKEAYELRASQIADKVYFSRVMKKLVSVKNEDLEILNNYAFELLNSYEDLSIQGIIAYELRKTTEVSFNRWADKNYMNKSLKKHYISEQGTPLDLQVKYINDEYNKDITEQDLVDFILSHPNGQETYKNEHQILVEGLASDFFAHTGISVNEKFAKMYRQSNTNFSNFINAEVPINEKHTQVFSSEFDTMFLSEVFLNEIEVPF